jgi:serine/threonine protein phosphatase 1
MTVTIMTSDATREPCAPPATRIYAVGDIHGRADLLSDLTQRIDEDLHRRPIEHTVEVYIGDYIDRGTDSKTVIDILCQRLVHRHAICLRGNHEAILEDFLQDASVIHDWIRLGGLSTLSSYGVSIDQRAQLVPSELRQTFARKFPRTHDLFLQCLRDHYTCGDYLFVHAGIRPGVALEHQVQDDLIWIRNEFLQSTADHGWIVVHGHTPVTHPHVRSNRINIDTGAVFSGTLTCLVLEGATVSFL